MKKVLFLIVLTAMFLIVSCGGDKNTDNTDTGETVTDEDTADIDSTDTTQDDGETVTDDDTDSTDTIKDDGDTGETMTDENTDDTDSNNGGGNNEQPESNCGNGKIEGNEVCDGDVACWQAGHFYPEGKATCNSDCSAYDTSKCIKRDPSDNCGNFQIDSGEACEQGNTKSCTELPGNYTQGEADCRRDCRGWNIENCSTGGKYRSCAQILDCVKVCADDSCKNACKEAGTDQGASLFADLEKCAASYGGVADKDCLTTNCYNEFYACNPSLRCGNGVLDDGEICENKETKPCQELNSAEKE